MIFSWKFVSLIICTNFLIIILLLCYQNVHDHTNETERIISFNTIDGSVVFYGGCSNVPDGIKPTMLIQ